MRRFYCRSGQISGQIIRIVDKTQVHHIRDVLRYKEEDEIFLFDETGAEFKGRIESINKNEIVIAIIKRWKSEGICRPVMTISCAIPKKSKIEDIIDTLTQLGADRIIPMITDRVIVKLDRDKKISKLARWEKVAAQASEQSGRKVLPAVGPVMTFAEVLIETRHCNLKLIPTLEGSRTGIRQILQDKKAQSIAVLIGPEGDFSPGEIREALAQGFIPVSLGELVLRVDTAAAAVTAFIRFSI